MKGASQKDEDVPYAVVVRDLPPQVEHHPGGVEQAARQEKGEPGGRQAVQDLLQGDDAKPPHEDVNGDGQFAKPGYLRELQDDPRKGKSPDNPENGPAPGPPQRDQCEGRIGARDEEKNRRMVELPEPFLDLRPGNTVIERRRPVEKIRVPPKTEKLTTCQALP